MVPGEVEKWNFTDFLSKGVYECVRVYIVSYRGCTGRVICSACNTNVVIYADVLVAQL